MKTWDDWGETRMKRLNESKIRRIVRDILYDAGVLRLIANEDLVDRLGYIDFGETIDKIETNLSKFLEVEVDLHGCTTWDEIIVKCGQYYKQPCVLTYTPKQDIFWSNGDPQEFLDKLLDIVADMEQDGDDYALNPYIESLKYLVNEYVTVGEE